MCSGVRVVTEIWLSYNGQLLCPLLYSHGVEFKKSILIAYLYIHFLVFFFIPLSLSRFLSAKLSSKPSDTVGSFAELCWITLSMIAVMDVVFKPCFYFERGENRVAGFEASTG